MKGSLRQRSPGSWELTIDTGRDALGRRQRKFVTVQSTKAQAQRRLRELLSILDKGLGLPAEKILLRDWLDRWMQEIIAPNRRQRTKERYQGIITRHIKPAIGHVQLTKLAPSHVQALESQLSARGMAAEGVGLVHRVLSGAMKHALRMELVYRNPVSAVVLPRIIRQEPAPPDITSVRAALELARAEEHYLYACIHLIAYTGMRRGEAMGLLWNDVDLAQGRILIERSLSRTLERGLYVDPPKTHSGRRVIDLDAGTIEVMAKHRAEQRTTKELMREMYKDHGKVFADPYGEWINPDNLSKAVKSFGQRVGHPEMTVRSLRHFHASVSLQSGQSIVIVSKRLGHASVSTTADIYAHSLPGWQKQAAEAFRTGDERRIGGKISPWLPSKYIEERGFDLLRRPLICRQKCRRRRQPPTYHRQPSRTKVAINGYAYNLQQPPTTGHFRIRPSPPLQSRVPGSGVRGRGSG